MQEWLISPQQDCHPAMDLLFHTHPQAHVFIDVLWTNWISLLWGKCPCWSISCFVFVFHQMKQLSMIGLYSRWGVQWKLQRWIQDAPGRSSIVLPSSAPLPLSNMGNDRDRNRCSCWWFWMLSSLIVPISSSCYHLDIDSGFDFENISISVAAALTSFESEVLEYPLKSDQELLFMCYYCWSKSNLFSYYALKIKN